ncbi:hypothetical protein EVAR_19543_1 [Eumeta japonica]|uniref:Uncharacterized protein n=1 Tax=Eumeta variegata TaxID=151549 RepID=A0A4C1UF00_EUMVA|nr:hypothetical protein EVAR_19543_1 [Eumeta japonica]
MPTRHIFRKLPTVTSTRVQALKQPTQPLHDSGLSNECVVSGAGVRRDTNCAGESGDPFPFLWQINSCDTCSARRNKWAASLGIIKRDARGRARRRPPASPAPPASHAFWLGAVFVFCTEQVIIDGRSSASRYLL